MALDIKFQGGKMYIKSIRKEALEAHRERIITILRPMGIKSAVSKLDDTTIMVEGNVEDLLTKLAGVLMDKKRA